LVMTVLVPIAAELDIANASPMYLSSTMKIVSAADYPGRKRQGKGVKAGTDWRKERRSCTATASYLGPPTNTH
jgi:hypothetical protein